MKTFLTKYFSFFCLILFSCQVFFSFANSNVKVFVSKNTFAHAYLIPLTSNNNHDNSDKKNDTHDQEESEEYQESEENEEGKELEVLSGASDPSKYQQLQDSPEYFYLLKSSEGILEEQFSPPECRV
jgi:hypothetical protein